MSSHAAGPSLSVHSGSVPAETAVSQGRFTKCPNSVLRRQDIKPGAKVAYMTLCSYAWRGDSCFPGQDRLARDMRVSRRKVVTYLRQLRNTGLIIVYRRGQGRTNVYRLPKICPSGSATVAHLEVQTGAHQEVQNQRTKKTKTEEDKDQEDGEDLSNIRIAHHPNQNLSGGVPAETDVQAPSIAGTVAGLPDSPAQSSRGSCRIPAARQKRHDPERGRIRGLIEDFARELNDEAPEASSVSRADNLRRRSDISAEEFTRLMYEARSLTQEHTAGIRKVSEKPVDGPWASPKNKMPYFFAILEQLANQHSAQRATAELETRNGDDGGTAPGLPSFGDHAPMGPNPTQTEIVGATSQWRPKVSADDEAPNPTGAIRAGKPTPEGSTRRRRRPSSRGTLLPVPRSPGKTPDAGTPLPGASTHAVRLYAIEVANDIGEGLPEKVDLDQVGSLFLRSGLSQPEFIRKLSEFGKIAKGADLPPGQARLPLFFAILRHQIGDTGVSDS
jgi:biotin operon repressor